MFRYYTVQVRTALYYTVPGIASLTQRSNSNDGTPSCNDVERVLSKTQSSRVSLGFTSRLQLVSMEKLYYIESKILAACLAQSVQCQSGRNGATYPRDWRGGC